MKAIFVVNLVFIIKRSNSAREYEFSNYSNLNQSFD